MTTWNFPSKNSSTITNPNKNSVSVFTNETKLKDLIAFDNVDADLSTTASQSFPFLNNGDILFILVVNESTATISNVSFDGDNATLATSTTADGYLYSIYYLVQPNKNLGNIAVTLSTSVAVFTTGLSYVGGNEVDQTDASSNPATNPVDLSLTTTSDFQWIIGVTTTLEPAIFLNGTQRVTSTFNGRSLNVFDSTTSLNSGLNTISFTCDDPTGGYAILSFKPSLYAQLTNQSKN